MGIIRDLLDSGRETPGFLEDLAVAVRTPEPSLRDRLAAEEHAFGASRIGLSAGPAEPQVGYTPFDIATVIAAGAVDAPSLAASVYATPTVALGSAAAAGTAATLIRSDATIAAFDAIDPSTQAFGDAAAVGAAAKAARRDHKHAMMANPVPAHEAAADPHTGYVLESLIDAAGDLIVGTADNAVGRLALGAAGGALSRVNGAVAWNSGTSFPTAATGDRFWRTDLGESYYYDGTRWLSTTLYMMPFTTAVLFPISAEAYPLICPIPFNTVGTRRDIWLVGWTVCVNLGWATDTSNYWHIRLERDSANIADVTTDLDGTGQILHTNAIGALTGTSDKLLTVHCFKTGSPATLIAPVVVEYRRVAT